MKRILYTLLSLLAFVSVGAQSQTFVKVTLDTLKGRVDKTIFVKDTLVFQDGSKQYTAYTDTTYPDSSILFVGSDGRPTTDSVRFKYADGVLSIDTMEFRSDFSTNTFIGRRAGINNTPLSTTQGRQNTFFGADAGRNNTIGYASLNVGYAAGFSNTTGSVNTNVGYQSGYGNVTGNFNTNLGVDAGARNTVSNNMFIGYHSGFGFPAVSTGVENIFIGNETAMVITSAFSNSIVGYRAGFGLTTGYNNVVFGALCGGALTTGFENILIGKEAGRALTTGTNNVFIGHRAGFAAQTSTYNNTGVGNNSLFNITTGNRNTGFGSGAGITITTGVLNTFMGFNAGNNASQGAGVSGSIAIGSATYTTGDNEIVIGASAVGNGANTTTIGSPTNTQTYLVGGLTVPQTPESTNTSDSILVKDATTGQVRSLPFQEGVYLPDDSLSRNLTDLTIDSAFYTRVGNIVTVSGTFTAYPTTGSGNTFFYMSLPISMQSLGDTYFVGGTFNAYSAQSGGAIIYGSQNRAVFQYQAGGTTPLVFSYTFSYRLR